MKFRFFSSRKAQGISMNTIVIAAIALIVLVVLVLIFTGNIGDFSGGVEEETNTCSGLNRVASDKESFTYSCKSSCTGGSEKTGDFIDCGTLGMKCCMTAKLT